MNLFFTTEEAQTEEGHAAQTQQRDAAGFRNGVESGDTIGTEFEVAEIISVQAERARAPRAGRHFIEVGADELPAVTQLFTEPYMVEFLLHNSLGAWCTRGIRASPAQLS